MARIISEVRPRCVYVENSPLLVGRGLALVLGQLADMGFDAEWACIPASAIGAPQARERLWLVAYANSIRQQGRAQWDGERPHPSKWPDHDGLALAQCRARNAKSHISRMDDAMAFGVDRLKAIGNGQVPEVAAAAWALLNSGFTVKGSRMIPIAKEDAAPSPQENTK